MNTRTSGPSVAGTAPGMVRAPAPNGNGARKRKLEPVDITLSQPITMDGAEIRAVRIPPIKPSLYARLGGVFTVRASADAGRGTDDMRFEINTDAVHRYIKTLTGLTDAALDDLDPSDYASLSQAIQDFLSAYTPA